MYFIYQTLIIREFYLLFLLEKFICMDKKLKKTFDSIIIFFVKISEVLIIFFNNNNFFTQLKPLWVTSQVMGPDTPKINFFRMLRIIF